MYRKNNGQATIFDFILPFGGHLKEDNRWVQLHKMIDWEIVDEEYRRNFKNKVTGQEAYPSSVAFGSVYIQRRLGLTDRELVDQIAENPYMQYFIGYKEYRSEKPFDPSLLVTFRKRLPEEVMNRIIERSFIKAAGKDDKDKDDKGGGSNSSGGGDSAGKPPKEPPNRGTLIIDATCTPADIAYPTDLELCDKARRWTEVILDRYWKLFGSMNGKSEKPRTYREIARRRFLKLTKRRKKSMKKIRKEIRYQLGCIRRNLDYIEDYAAEYGLDCLFRVQRDRLLTIVVFYDQQKEMLDTKTHRVEDRIVSLSQPWIRPIVRGKSKAPTEFGAKISVSIVNGYTFIDRLSFDAYNEGESSEFERVVEKYRQRFGHYPERILADKIYRSKSNRSYCKEHGIRMSGPKLGRPGKDHAADIRQELQEIGERNEVECKIGNGKRKLGLSLIMAKLQITAGSMIGMDIFILNMEKLMRQEASLLYAFFEIYIIRPFAGRRQLATSIILEGRTVEWPPFSKHYLVAVILFGLATRSFVNEIEGLRKYIKRYLQKYGGEIDCRHYLKEYSHIKSILENKEFSNKLVDREKRECKSALKKMKCWIYGLRVFYVFVFVVLLMIWKTNKLDIYAFIMLFTTGGFYIYFILDFDIFMIREFKIINTLFQVGKKFWRWIGPDKVEECIFLLVVDVLLLLFPVWVLNQFINKDYRFIHIFLYLASYRYLLVRLHSYIYARIVYRINCEANLLNTKSTSQSGKEKGNVSIPKGILDSRFRNDKNWKCIYDYISRLNNCFSYIIIVFVVLMSQILIYNVPYAFTNEPVISVINEAITAATTLFLFDQFWENIKELDDSAYKETLRKPIYTDGVFKNKFVGYDK